MAGLLTPQEIAQARNWINTQWGGDGSLPGFGAAFNGDVYDPSNTQRNWGVLGAGQAMGYGADDMSQILGLSAGDISNYGQQNQVHSDTYADIFRADNPGAGVQPTQPQQPSFTGNPYATEMASDIGRRSTQAFNDMANGIRSHSAGVGGLGGSRQGVAEGIMGSRSLDSLQGNLGNLFGGLYESDQNRGLQKYNIEGNQNLANQGQWMNFYTNQRGQDMDQTRLGADLFNLGTNGQWGPITQANNVYNDYTGLGSTTNSSKQGGGWQGAVGGALTGASLGRQMKWW